MSELPNIVATAYEAMGPVGGTIGLAGIIGLAVGSIFQGIRA